MNWATARKLSDLVGLEFCNGGDFFMGSAHLVEPRLEACGRPIIFCLAEANDGQLKRLVNYYFVAIFYITNDKHVNLLQLNIYRIFNYIK